MRTKSLLALIVSIFVLCAYNAGARESKPKVDKPGAKDLVKNSKDCPPNSLAAKFKVPHEPGTGLASVTLFNTGARQASYELLKSDKQFLGARGDDPATPTKVCFLWDLKDPKGELDYVTCRLVIQTPEGPVMSVFPVVYALDVKGDAKGDVSKFAWFVDPNSDGNLCDLKDLKTLEPQKQAPPK